MEGGLLVRVILRSLCRVSRRVGAGELSGRREEGRRSGRGCIGCEGCESCGSCIGEHGCILNVCLLNRTHSVDRLYLVDQVLWLQILQHTLESQSGFGSDHPTSCDLPSCHQDPCFRTQIRATEYQSYLSKVQEEP